MSDLQIIGLIIKNFKGIKYAEMEFDPEAKIIKFCGPNDSGKTTIGQVLQFSLFGKKSISDDAVTHGEQNLETTLDLGEFKIIRRHPSTKLEIVYPNGLTREKGKQDFLRSLQNEWAFDPSPILDMKPDELLKHLMKTSGLDFTEIDNKIKQLEKLRYDTGVEERAIGEIKEVYKVGPVSMLELLEKKNRIQMWIEAELDGIREFNQTQNERNGKILNAKRELAVYNTQIQELQEKLKIAIGKRDSTLDLLDTLPEPEEIKDEIASQNTTEIDLDIIRGNDLNLDHEKWKINEEKRAAKAEMKAKYKDFGKKIESSRDVKKKKLESADFGINGLRVTESGVYLGDTYCQDLSYSKRLKMAWELNVNAGKFPIKAFFIDTGESLDPEKFDAMEKLAKEKGLQFFVTIRTDPGDIPEDHPSNVFYLEELKK